ncbi:MAG: hypothetical protein WKF71_01045 [Pyrinomonadaceae bacterium]
MPCKSCPRHFVRDVIAEFRVACDDFRRHVRLDGLHIRRHEQARAVRALLVNVVDDLRMPLVVNFINGQLRLNLRERIPIAVVVVSDVFVIKLRRRGSFKLCAERFVIPIFDNINAVRI